MVPRPGGVAGHHLRHPGGHLELRLHPGRAHLPQAALPRPQRDGPARHHPVRARHARRGGLAQRHRRAQGELRAPPRPGPPGPPAGDRTRGQRSAAGALLAEDDCVKLSNV